MKKMLTILFAAWIAAAMAQAGPPDLMNYQGRLVDTNGDPVNGTVSVVVRIFTQASGGTEIWEQNVGNVDVAGGMYTLQFGDAGLIGAFNNAETWLELEVNSETLSPRHRLSSVPYALRAAVADQLGTPLAGIPTGGIAIWSGTLQDVPEGWVLCDGDNDTPDLRELFIMGAATGQDPGDTGGAHTLTLAVNQMPAHTHTATAGSAGSHSHSASTGSGGSHSNHGGTTGSGGSHSHSMPADNSLGSQTGRIGGGVGGSRTSQSEEGFNSRNHSHSVNSLSSGGAHTHSAVTANAAGSHNHTVTVNSTGSGESIENRPAFYALAFIMKL